MGDFAYVDQKYDYDHKGNLISISNYQPSGERVRLETFEIADSEGHVEEAIYSKHEWNGSWLMSNPDEPGKEVQVVE